VANAYNERADTFDTVGDLYRYILQHRRPRPPVACLTASTFYHVRRGIMTVLQSPRDRIRPDSKLEEFLPSQGRRKAWKSLQDSICLKLPPLQLPVGIMKGALLLGLATWPLCFLAAYQAKGLLPAIFLTVFPGCSPILVFMGTLTTCMLISPIHTELPGECQTVGGLTRSIIKESYGSQALEKDRWDDHEVWEDLVSLIEKYGYRREEISENTRFLSDLGAYTL